MRFRDGWGGSRVRLVEVAAAGCQAPEHCAVIRKIGVNQVNDQALALYGAAHR